MDEVAEKTGRETPRRQAGRFPDGYWKRVNEAIAANGAARGEKWSVTSVCKAAFDEQIREHETRLEALRRSEEPFMVGARRVRRHWEVTVPGIGHTTAPTRAGVGNAAILLIANTLDLRLSQIRIQIADYEKEK
jgi:hypothetical protein